MIRNMQSAQIPQKQDGCHTYVIMKTMYPPGYCHNGFVTTDALGHMSPSAGVQVCELPFHVPKWLSCHQAIVITGSTNCFHHYVKIDE